MWFHILKQEPIIYVNHLGKSPLPVTDFLICKIREFNDFGIAGAGIGDKEGEVEEMRQDGELKE